MSAGESESERRSQRTELLKMKEQLQLLLSDIDTKLAATETTSSSATPALRKPAQRAVRLVVLDALEDLDWPAYSREVSQFCSARFGREIPAHRFGTLAFDEMQSFQRSTPRPVWLCFALTYDRHQSIKRLWARSDWQLERRIVAPTTGRVQHLKITSKLCELASQSDGTADVDMLAILAADHARDLPGVKVQRGRFELDAWREMADTLLRDVEPRDAEIRAESAKRLTKRSDIVQLFGMPDVADAADVPVKTRGGNRR